MNNQPSDKDIVLKAQGLAKWYGSHQALDDLSFEVRAGEMLGLLGPNGAGKTTAIRILTTILKASQGSFTVLGIPDSRPAEIRALIGVVPESNGFPRTMTGEGYLIYIGRLYGLTITQARETAGRLLRLVGLQTAADALTSTYSLGMRRRLGIARALINSPRVLFLDEPTLGIDPVGHREILQVIQQTAETDRVAVILSSHLLEVTEKICSRVLILNRGRVIAEGSVADVKRQVSPIPACRIQVPIEAIPTARSVLVALGNVDVSVNSNQHNEIIVSGKEQTSQVDMNAILQHLLQAGVTIEAFANDTASLSDVFLSMVEEGKVG